MNESVPMETRIASLSSLSRSTVARSREYVASQNEPLLSGEIQSSRYRTNRRSPARRWHALKLPDLRSLSFEGSVAEANAVEGEEKCRDAGIFS